MFQLVASVTTQWFLLTTNLRSFHELIFHHIEPLNRRAISGFIDYFPAFCILHVHSIWMEYNEFLENKSHHNPLSWRFSPTFCEVDMSRPVLRPMLRLEVPDQPIHTLLWWCDEVDGLHGWQWLSVLVNCLHDGDALSREVLHCKIRRDSRLGHSPLFKWFILETNFGHRWKTVSTVRCSTAPASWCTPKPSSWTAGQQWARATRLGPAACCAASPCSGSRRWGFLKCQLHVRVCQSQTLIFERLSLTHICNSLRRINDM